MSEVIRTRPGRGSDAVTVAARFAEPQRDFIVAERGDALVGFAEVIHAKLGSHGLIHCLVCGSLPGRETSVRSRSIAEWATLTSGQQRIRSRATHMAIVCLQNGLARHDDGLREA
jgi:hypothetical protein